ncbi:MAG: hypothetical protein K2Y39_27650 [Candidatus Obscuribacterales bacterium]|nr:hypothetical protein [Candidatus Obscuribacterales bacterium]
MKSTLALLHEVMKLAATDLHAAHVRMLNATPCQLMQIVLPFTSSEADLQVATLILLMVSTEKLGAMSGLADLIVPATENQIVSARARLYLQEQRVADALAAALDAQAKGSYEASGLAEYYLKQIAIREKRKGLVEHFSQSNTRATRINTLLKAEAARRAAL